MRWQEFLKDYLSFTRKERIGILVIITFMFFILSLPEIISRISNKQKTEIDTTWFNVFKTLEIKATDSSIENYQNKLDDNVSIYQNDKSEENYFERNSKKGELFTFDPNTISESTWKKLGLRDRTIKTIQNFRNKGGSFKKPEDLQKIYGLHIDEFERLAPFIKIETTKLSSQNESVAEKTQPENKQIKNAASRYNIIEINKADTTAFISLPGIGSKLAARIVNFRDKLGGFYSIEQVGETFGLPDTTFQKIKQYLMIEATLIKKININKATVDELKAHPYIKYSLANPIVAFRNEHGNFSKVEDIKQIMVVTEEIYKKINPYLSTQ